MRTLNYKHLMFLTIFLLLLFPAFGQTSADIENLLAERAISFEQAAWFILASALNEVPDSSQAAFALAVERGWIPAKAESGNPITFNGLSLLLMKAFEINGGMMYRFTENKRYAYRELRSREYITGRAYSGITVSGEQFLQILGNIMSDRGGEL